MGLADKRGRKEIQQIIGSVGPVDHGSQYVELTSGPLDGDVRRVSVRTSGDTLDYVRRIENHEGDFDMVAVDLAIGYDRMGEYVWGLRDGRLRGVDRDDQDGLKLRNVEAVEKNLVANALRVGVKDVKPTVESGRVVGTLQKIASGMATEKQFGRPPFDPISN